MHKLNVPLKRQLPNSVECGLVCLEMIYSYYKNPKDIESLRKELLTTSIGTYSPQLGLHLLKNGFKVEIVTYNPKLVSKADKNLNQKELLNKLRNIHKIADKKDKLVLNYFIEFIENGGKVIVKVPSKKEIEEEIKKKRPLLAAITTAPLYSKNIIDKPIDDTFHFVIITGIENDKVIVNDPYFLEDGGEKEYPVEDFLFAVYASALGDLDNGCFIKIKKSNN